MRLICPFSTTIPAALPRATSAVIAALNCSAFNRHIAQALQIFQMAFEGYLRLFAMGARN